MENILDSYGFKKISTYTWFNDPFKITIYYDCITIFKCIGNEDISTYEGVIPNIKLDRENLIETQTKIKKINPHVTDLLNSTKSKRIYSNTSLYISNMLINHIKNYNNTTEKELCDKLNIDVDKLKEYLSGSYNFTLEDLSKISVLIDKIITIK